MFRRDAHWMASDRNLFHQYYDAWSRHEASRSPASMSNTSRLKCRSAPHMRHHQHTLPLSPAYTILMDVSLVLPYMPEMAGYNMLLTIQMHWKILLADDSRWAQTEREKIEAKHMPSSTTRSQPLPRYFIYSECTRPRHACAPRYYDLLIGATPQSPASGTHSLSCRWCLMLVDLGYVVSLVIPP